MYDFRCTITTGTGKTKTVTARNVEGFEPIDIVYNAGEGTFTDDECSKDGQSCNERKNVLTRGIKRGQVLGADPAATRDGYRFAAFKDKDGNECNMDESYIEATKLDTEYQFKSYLACKNESDYLNTFIEDAGKMIIIKPETPTTTVEETTTKTTTKVAPTTVRTTTKVVN